ncbi:HET-domain-containing protein [Delitschia confertaspora ATCC 74209]|uniref:HET-domain-containing protein n=1 Tax=Delitschia confertaspora ATCC 74209 TaxID=1513339 RepID=A0A9P4MUY7_9PLEO|nr:HET-domain-containing protein [Delitschia confertaspora ATCC 74209]
MDQNHKPYARAYPFRIFTTHDNPAATEIRERPLTTDIGLDSSYDFIQRCFDQCHNTHGGCTKVTGIFPSRLIDVGSQFPISGVTLYWPAEGESGKYAALSYCWGGQQPLQTTHNTAQDFTDGIIFAQLPKTIQDAIVTTFKLGLRYIWIDCLCIIQDDPEDVTREIAKMSQIFQQAFVTISASSARNVNEGFLDPRTPEIDSRLKLPYQTAEGSMGVVIIERPQMYSPEQEPINLRAWTLQKRMLSRNILNFGSRDLWWVCQSAVVHDNGHDTLANPPQGGHHLLHTNSNSLESWRSVVQDYTSRFLTFSSDKLPAISGVAEEYAKIFSWTYLAGLWQFCLPSELLWSKVRSDISRPPLQRAPSWSWASVDGEINHNWCPNHSTTSLTIIDCRAVPVSTISTYSSVDPLLCVLKIRGQMMQFLWTEDRKYLMNLGGPSHSWVGRTHGDADEPCQLQHPNDSTSKYYVVWALVVTHPSTRGLILNQIGENTFKRVRMFFRLLENYLDSGFTERTITIL